MVESKVVPLLSSDSVDDIFEGLTIVQKKGLRQYQGYAEELLDHSDADVRRAAIKVVVAFDEEEDFEAEVRAMALHDSDELCRSVAFEEWAQYLDGGNPDLARVHHVLQDRQEPDIVRAGAYTCFLEVTGYLDSLSPLEMLNITDVAQDVDDQVDWDLVDRLWDGTTASRKI